MRRLVALSIALFLAACGDDDASKALTGKWNVEGSDGFSMALLDDGKMETKRGEEVVASGTWELKDGKLAITATLAGSSEASTLACDYKIEGKTLTLSGEGDCGTAPTFTKME